MAYDDRANAGGGDGRGAPRGQRERRQTINLVDVAKIFESLPPHAVEAEMSLLGSMLWDPRVVGDVVTVVKSGSDFYRPAHGLIYDTMVELYDRNGSLDLVTLSQKLVDKAILEEVGGLDYLVELAEGVPSAVNAPHYAGIVREKATVRELIAAAGEILTDAHQSREPAQDLLERAEQKIFHIAQRRESNSTAEIRDLINETMKLLEQNEGRHLTGVTSGFVDLDEMLSGFQRGELIILAARPSMGKTALASTSSRTWPARATRSRCSAWKWASSSLSNACSAVAGASTANGFGATCFARRTIVGSSRRPASWPSRRSISTTRPA